MCELISSYLIYREIVPLLNEPLFVVRYVIDTHEQHNTSSSSLVTFVRDPSPGTSCLGRNSVNNTGGIIILLCKLCINKMPKKLGLITVATAGVVTGELNELS